MWLVLCHADDVEAVWAYHGLRARGMAPLELVTAEALAFALQWDHRVSSTGASFEVTLAGGRRIVSGQVRGTLNRIQHVPAPHWRSASERDREYVQQELFAFFTSCLHSLPGPVLNPAGALGLSGTPRCPAEWRLHAARAGLPDGADGTNRRSASSAAAAGTTGGTVEGADPAWIAERVTAWVVGDTVVGVPVGLEPCCRDLAGRTGTPLLGVDLVRRPDGEWAFASATHVPPLSRGGAPLLNALAAALTAARGPR
jgi:hypothetical protein